MSLKNKISYENQLNNAKIINDFSKMYKINIKINFK